MSARPRKGRRVGFGPAEAAAPTAPRDAVAGLRFTIVVQHGGSVLVDFTGLRPRGLALAFAHALQGLAGFGGPLGVRSTVKAYATSLPRFFQYLAATGERVSGPQDVHARHVDGFEAWLEAQGLSRPHLFTLLVKVVALLRQVATDDPQSIAPELRERLRYVSAKRFEQSRPRDALSPFVARQLREAARADAAAIATRLLVGPPAEDDPELAKASAAAHAVIAGHGVLTEHHPETMQLYRARWRRGLTSPRLVERLHGAHYLTAADIVPFLVLLALETGLEIECCKTLKVDCLRNAAAGTVEIAYLKRRARGAEHKTIRVRDGGSTTPGGLIRRLIELTAAARRHRPSDSLWLYYRWGALSAGILHPRATIDAWTARHGITDDDGRPLRLVLSSLRKTHKALWYLKSEGRMARFAVGHTAEVAARHYADVPALRPLHEATVAAALEDALAGPRIIADSDEAGPEMPDGDGDPPISPDALSAQELWLASCQSFYASPFGEAGAPCPTPFWGCLACSNAVITARKLPAILSFLAFVEGERTGLSATDWAAKFGEVHTRITRQILPAFSATVLAQARASLADEPPAIYLPPEVRA